MSGAGRQRRTPVALILRGRNGASIWLRRRRCSWNPRCCRTGGRKACASKSRVGVSARSSLDAKAQPGDERVAVALPGMRNVHSHGFQRGMAGLTEFRGPAADNFWSWRTLMYRFVARMTPDDLEAVTALAYVEMLESGFTRVGEFHYVHHDPAGTPYADPAETSVRVAAAAGANRHRAHVAAGVLRAWRIRRRAAERGPAPLRDQHRRLRTLVRRRRARQWRRWKAPRSEWRRIRCAPSRPMSWRRVVALAGSGPMHIHAAEQTGEVEQCLAWSGARPVQWLLDHAASG